MKKNKIVIIVLILGILFLTSYLYNSYATSTGVSLGNDENTYDILLNDSTDTVSVPAKSSKTIYYQFSNTNKGTINYHIGYISNNVIAKEWWDTEDRIFGTIEQGVTKFIKLKLINETDTDDTITIKPVLGYVNGGDLIVPDDTTLVTDTINEINTMSIGPSPALNTLGIAKTAVEEISFVKDNIVPSNSLGSTNMNNDGSIKLWYIASDTEGMYKIYIGSDNGITTFPSNCNSLFNGYTKVISINLDNIDTSNVTRMAAMFMLCSNLVNINLDNFDTSNVTTMSELFRMCKSLTTLDLNSFYTPKLTGSITRMFEGCTNLEKLSMDNINTSAVDNMSYMFSGCSNLDNFDLTVLDTSSVKNMTYMFYQTKMSKITIDTSSAENMTYMFYLSKANLLDLSTFNTFNVKNMAHMFNGSKVISLELGNFNTSKVKDMSHMFENCSNLSELKLGNFDTSNVDTMAYMFSNTKLTKIDIDTSNVKDLSHMFDGSKAQTLDLSSLDTSSATNMNRMFYNTTIRELDISNFTVGETDISEMFRANHYLSSLDMRNADLSNVTAYSNMFNGDVPTTVNIYLKDTQGNRDFMSNNFSTYTNVQYIPSS